MQSVPVERYQFLGNSECNSDSSDGIADIKYIGIKNTILKQEIQKYIRELDSSYSVFKKGFGYIVVQDIEFNSSTTYIGRTWEESKKDTIAKFTLIPGSYLLKLKPVFFDSFCANCFPPFYSFIDGRLVLIEDPDLNWINDRKYTRRSKENLVKLVRSTLTLALQEDFEFYDVFDKKYYKLSKEKRKTMTEDQILEEAAFAINEGKTVILHEDGSISYKR